MLDRERGPGFLIVIVLAMVGVFYARVEPGQTAGSMESVVPADAIAPKSQALPRAAEGQCLEGSEPVRFLCRFFGDSNVKAVPGPRGWRSMPWVGLVHNQKVTFVIATVPDPQMTRLSLYFDRSLSSIQAAVASEQWRFDRAWLPWKPVSATSGEPGPFDAEAAETMPGLMVFRGSTGEAVVVFLIGESPVAGIRRPAFQEAVSIIEGLTQGAPSRVLIAGPNFSGAFPSLRQEIDLVACKPEWKAEFRVISPNSTVGGAQEGFTAKPAVGNIRFSRILSRDDGALAAFSDYLTSHWGSDINSAFIAEGETVYGLQAQQANEGEGGKATRLSSAGKTFNFPREIALLRNLYPDAARQTFGSSAAQQKSGATDLKLRSGGRPTLPVFAEQQTVTSYEAQLLQIALALDRDGFDIAGLAATDVLDMIYVAGYLRRAAPETRLYMLDADLLLVRATSSYALDGTMLLTDFPLVLENRIWTNWLDRTPYSSRWEMATFNAVRALLLEHRQDGSPLLEYGDPFQADANRPPIWLTIVSHDSLWPIATFPEKDANNRLTWKPSAVHNENLLRVVRPSLGWVLLNAILALGGLALFSLIAAACSISLRRQAESLEMFCFSANGIGLAGRTYYLLSLCLLMAGLIVTQLTPVLAVPQFRADFGVHLILPVIALAALALASGRILFKGAPAFRCKPDPGEVETVELRKAFGLLTVLSAAAFSLFLVVWSIAFLWTSREAHGEVYFRAYRSLDITSGVSPVLPLLLLGLSLLLLMMMHFRRYILFVREHPFLPDVGADPFLQRLNLGENPLLRLVSWPFLGLKEAPLIFLVAIAIPLTLGGPQSLESWSYDLLYVFSLVLVIVLAVQVWLRFLAIWRAAKVVLESLESHPLREAFNALPPEFSDVPLFGGANRYRTNIVFCRSLDLVRALEARGIPPQELYDAPHSHIPELERKLKLYLGPDADVPEGAMADHRSLDYEFCLIANRLFCWLQGYWEKGRTAREVTGRTTAAETHVTLAEEFIALRYATLVRYTMLQLRNLLAFLAGGFFLTVVSGLVYPFRSQHLLGWVATGSLVVLGLPVLLALFQMDHDPMLSRLRSKDGASGHTRFALRAVLYGLPAIIALAGTHFPGLSRFFGNWMAPALQALSK